MPKASQWDKLRKVINGVRTGHIMTDEAILEISYILGVEVGTNNPFELIETPNSGIAPTEDSSDEEVWERQDRRRVESSTDRMTSDEADEQRELLEAFNKSNLHEPDIRPTGDSRDRSGISDEEANRRASAFQAHSGRVLRYEKRGTGRIVPEPDRMVAYDKLHMARIVPEAVKSAIADDAAKLDRTDEEFEMNESGGYPVLPLGLLQFGRPERKQTNLTLHDVMDKLHDYDELRLQAKTVFADLMAQTWEHFVTRACGHLSGRYPTADYFRQYVLDWFNLDIRA